MLTPEEEARKIWLPPGFKVEPVLADPHIEESAQIAFDGNGRMFVLELRSYMQDADAGGELDPISRISMHEDRDNDGKYETHKIFVDKLVFPRFVMPYGANAVLTMESNADEVWKFTDTNNDGAADKKELFATGFGRLANVEHQQSGLFWAMDNWFYSTVNAFRARPSLNGGPIRQEPTGGNNAQWGAAMDNYGKVYFQGGASGMPGYFQLPVHYGNFSVPDQFEENLNITWGAPVLIADMQGGLPAVRMPDGSLNRTTAGAGNDVFRGHRLPKDMVGDYFYGETVARIVRRLRPVKADGLTQMRNVYPLSEFIRSTDPLFRPVDMTTAPDGTMYITDMYRGIIQQATWSGRGTYLRRKIEQYQLDKVTKHGRIWRLSYEGMERDKTQPRMLNETPAQLVAHLSHPNGWWRDTAQQLLVLGQDKSVVPALQKLAATRGASNQLARIHALWTLEGLGALDASFVREQLKDADPQIRIQAIRASETLYKAGDRSFAADYRAAAKDGDADVAIQAMLTSKLFNLPDLKAIVESAQAANKARGVQVIGTQILNPAAANAGRGGGGGRGGPPPFTADEAAVIDRGDKVYKELCFTLPRPGRPRRAAGRRSRRHDHGAVAGRLAPGDRTYRLRDQDDAARHDRPARREDLSGGRDDAAWRQRRSVGRGHRVVRAQQLRQPRRVRQRGGRGQGARVDRRTQDVVDARRTGGLGPEGHGRAADMENDGQPQRAGGRGRADVHDLEHERAAAARHVVPGGIAGGCPARRDSIRVARRAWRWRRRRTRQRSSGECAGCGPRPGSGWRARGRRSGRCCAGDNGRDRGAGRRTGPAGCGKPAAPRHSSRRRPRIPAATRSKCRWTAPHGGPSPRAPAPRHDRPARRRSSASSRCGPGSCASRRRRRPSRRRTGSIQRLRLYEVGEEK